MCALYYEHREEWALGGSALTKLDEVTKTAAGWRYAKAMAEPQMPIANAPKPRLLFVEDEATVREHLAERLSDEYLVDTAGNGNEALLAVMRAKPALVVTDIVMPDMDGVELLKTLRHAPGTRGIPVLLISGRAAEDHRIEGFEEGADGFLPKPYTETELRALIGL